jgi:site-specific DNA-methyltransferase (adenine-specific)
MDKMRLDSGNITLIRGDCLEIMPKMKSGIICAVINDPPYGTTKCKWDSVLPLDTLWKEYKRIAASTANFIFTASQPFTSVLISSQLDLFKYCWVWSKGKAANFPQVKYAPLKVHEDVIVFSNKSAVYNAQMTEGSFRKKGGYFVDREFAVSAGTAATHNNVYYPKSILDFSIAGNKDSKLHPTQKPVALMEYLIKTYTNENDIVLDNTMGSGTTAVACINTNRRFVGIEKEQNYFDICIDRCNKALAEKYKLAA